MSSVQAPPDVLAHIAAYKRVDVAARRLGTSHAEIDRQAADAPPVRPFAQALRRAARPDRPA